MNGPREIFLIETHEDPLVGTVLMQPAALPEVLDHVRYIRADVAKEQRDELLGALKGLLQVTRFLSDVEDDAEWDAYARESPRIRQAYAAIAKAEEE